MMHTPTEEEREANKKKLIDFCKENHCLMYNYMLTIREIRRAVIDKLKVNTEIDEFHTSIISEFFDADDMNYDFPKMTAKDLLDKVDRLKKELELKLKC